ncbi:MAG: FKBP-type peptidyl-prolyl cis-trans isomerase [Ginsengibacter sp.]
MTKIFSALILISIFASCVKNDTKCSYTDSTVTVPAAEIQALQDSLTVHNIQGAMQHPSGFFYTIGAPGSGAGIANLCSSITVTYRGSFFNDHVFDSTAAGQVATFQLGMGIVGWQKALPLISKGGQITLYIPPTLGYGSTPATDSQGNVVIPANSYLIFNINLADIH